LRTTRLWQQLALGYGLVLLMLLAMTALALVTQQEMADRMARIVDVDGAKADGVVEMTRHVNASALSMRNLSVINNPADLADEYNRLVAHLKDYDGARKAFETLLARVGESAPEKAQWARVSQAEAAARQIMALAASKTQSTAADDLAIGIRTELRTDLERWNSALAAWIEQMDELRRMEVDTSRHSVAAMREASAQARWTLVGVAVVALALGVFAAWRMTRKLTRAARVAVEAAHRIASGDLTEAIPASGDGEMAQLLAALESMRVQLHDLASQVQHATRSIGAASDDIAHGNDDLARRTEQTAASLEQTAASMAALRDTVGRNADVAKEGSELATSAAQAAARGGQVASRAVAQMEEIGVASRQITEIISVIDGIAARTNILALNAGVEAARAGDQGRGFAVVAGEVRSLAQRSAEAALEIKRLIERSGEKVQQGSRHVREAGEAMSQIVGSVERLAGLMGDISERAAEQRTGIAEVNQAVAQLDQMTQRNAAMVQHSTDASRSLRAQAGTLAQVVSAFRLDGISST
jgi:methyl-accepting chemotaxis protein